MLGTHIHINFNVKHRNLKQFVDISNNFRDNTSEIDCLQLSWRTPMSFFKSKEEHSLEEKNGFSFILITNDVLWVY